MNKNFGATLIFCLAVMGFLAASAGVADAKQCIWNKAGFVLKVRWYEPADLIGYKADAKGDVVIEQRKDPVQIDQWPTAQGRCTTGVNESKKLTAVLEVVNGKIASGAAKMLVGTVCAAVAGSALAVACFGTAGGACVAVVGSTLVAGVAGAAIISTPESNIPDGKDIFLVTTPSESTYLDVWGTVWSPQSGPGGKID
jgi:hypothetical protein